MRLSVLQYDTLSKELAKYLLFDQKLTDFEKETLLKTIHPLMDYDKIEDIPRKWMRVLLYYFISHIDEEGNIVSLEQHQQFHPLIKEHYTFLLRMEHIFLSNLKETMQSKLAYYQQYGSKGENNL